MENQAVGTVKRIGVGLAFISYPILSGFAFFAHTDLLSLEIGVPIGERVAQFHNKPFLHFGHFMMLLGVPALIVVAAKFMSMLREHGAWLGLIGGLMAGFGAVLLAVDKTALCLVMSAFDTVPEGDYAALLPGIEALFQFKGYLAVLYLLPLLPVGFLLQGIGLYRARAVPRWQSVALIASTFGLIVAAAVDIDLFGLIATALLAIAFFPIGFRFIKGEID